MKATRWKIGAVALTMTVLLGACGSSSAGTKSKSASSGSKPLTKVTVAYASTGAGFSDLYVGVADGIFKQYGLDVKLVQVTPADLVPALLSGSAQIGGGVADGTASAILKGEQLKYIALTEGTYNLQLWVKKSVTSIAGLSGQSLALTTEGSETDFALTQLLQENGLSSTSVSRKYLVSSAEMLTAVRSGTVAGGLFQPPTAQTLTSVGGHILTSLSNLPYAVGAYISPDSYVSSHATAIKDFYAAEAANLTYLRTHPAQTEAAIVKYNTETSAADAKIAYKFFLNVWKKTPSVTSSLIEAAFKRAAAKANTTAPTSVTKYIYSSS